ncbi:Hpt domain-containing protein [Thermodesulfatator indicus]|uniref:Hpt domain-containing protein n=1 Tax=Thermodesulfatator indicus TaxID=171695 RepID=UPI000314A9BC|nr:Hpt domain-containing protein [Thermodesulfatator indicus]
MVKWNREKLLQELDQEELKELLEVFLFSSKQLLDEMEKALSSGEINTVREKAHSLKGACATIFLEEARDLAFNLEKAINIDEAQNLFEKLKKELTAFWQMIEKQEYR